MPHATLTCPHCKATLRPAKPVMEGKTVKCPKCSEFFKAPEKQEAAAKRAASPNAIKPKDDDDGGIYLVARDPEEEARKAAEEEKQRRKKRKKLAAQQGEDVDEEEEEDESDDPVQQYLKAVKVKDPRGPAQAAVVGSSNWLLRMALVGFFGWAITLVVFLIPVAFPNLERAEDVDKWGRKIVEEGDTKKKENTHKPIFEMKDILSRPIFVVGFASLVVFGFLHACLLGVGAVKILHLESWGWGVTGSILTMIPLHLMPFWYFLWTLLEFAEMYDSSWAVAMVILVAGPLVGASCLRVLKRPDVQAGFYYVAD